MKKSKLSVISIYSLLLLSLPVIIFNCKDDAVAPPINSEVIIPATTKVVDSTDFANHFVSLSNDSTVYTFSKGSASIDNLMVNDVLVSKFRRGILRKVTAVQTNNQNTIITTTNTTICDAVQKGGVSVSRTLTPEDTLMINPGPGVKLKGMKNDNLDVIIYSATFEKTEGPLSITGSITLSESFNFSIQIENWSIVNLVFSATPSVVTQINGSCNVLNLNFQKEWELATINFNPITIYIGTVPVVITPSIRIFVDANGSVHAGVSSSINQTSTVTGGLQYSNGNWSPISSHSESFTFTPPTYSAQANLKASVGADLTLLLYGFAGPYVEPSFFGDLQVQSNLNATLFIGFDLDAGVAVQILGHNIANHSMTHVVFVNNPVWTNSGGGLSAPTLISPPNGATNQPLAPTLDWGDVTSATNYRVQVSLFSTFSSNLVDQFNLTTSQYNIPNGLLNNNTQCYWRVIASNAYGSSPWSSVWNFTTIGSSGLPAPTLISPPNGATNQSLTPTLDWSDVSGATSYRVQVSTSSSFTTTVVDQQNLTTSQFSIPNGLLTNNTQYYWRANASNSQNTSAWSSVWGFSPGLPAPTLISPPNGATNQPLTPTLDWTDVTGSTNYRVQVSTSSTFTTTVVDQQNLTTSQFSVPPGLLSNSTQYYWRANASNSQSLNPWSVLPGISPWSVTWSFTTIGSTGLPAPTLLAPPNGATNQPLTPTLDWSDVTGATAYRVQVSTSSTFTTTVVDQQNLTSSQYTVPSGLLSNNTLYYWRANAFNPQYTSSWSSVWSFITIGSSGFPAPTLLAPPNGATNQSLTPTLDWSDVTGATAYRVQVSTSSSFTTTVVDQQNLTSSQYIIPSGLLSNNTLYYWRANASNSQSTSPWSSVWSFTTITGSGLPAPTLISPPNGATNQPLTPTLDWSDVTGATTYRVQVSISSSFTSTVVDQQNLTSSQYSIPSGLLSNNTLYYWRANASNSQSTSPWSSVWNFATIQSSGGSWSSLGSGMNNIVKTVTTFNGLLIAGGSFTTAGGNNANYIAQWNGSSWAPLGSGMTSNVNTSIVYNSVLIANGGINIHYLGQWDGSNWLQLGSGLNNTVYSSGIFNGTLIAGGVFTMAGGNSANRIAQWNGSSWSSLGGGLGSSGSFVYAITEYNGLLIAGGTFGIYQWNGSSWASLGSADGTIWSLTVYNGNLIVGGSFYNIGGISANSIAQWNGSSWSPLQGLNGSVLALTVYNNKLIAGGSFTSFSKIAQWNGSAWSQIGSGMNNSVWALGVYNNSLIAGGQFSIAGGVTVNCIAQWNE